MQSLFEFPYLLKYFKIEKWFRFDFFKIPVPIFKVYEH